MIHIHTLLIGQPQLHTDARGTWRSAIYRTPVAGGGAFAVEPTNTPVAGASPITPMKGCSGTVMVFEKKATS